MAINILYSNFILPGGYAEFDKGIRREMQVDDMIEMNKDLLDVLTQSIQRAAEVKFPAFLVDFKSSFQRKKKELDEYDRQQGERWSKIFESATEFILNLLAKTNRRFTEYEIHQRLVNTTFLDSGTLRDGKLIENGPTGTEMQRNITQANVGQDRMNYIQCFRKRLANFNVDKCSRCYYAML